MPTVISSSSTSIPMANGRPTTPGAGAGPSMRPPTATKRTMSTASVNGAPPGPLASTVSNAPGGSGGGLRGHLKHLLPRHSLFAVHVTIHELSSVPLVHGDFGVRWRFKNVQAGGSSAAALGHGLGTGVGGSSSHRLLDRMRGGGGVSRSAVSSPASSQANLSNLQAQKTASTNWKGKGRAVDRGESFEGDGGTIRPGMSGVLINVVDAPPDNDSVHGSSSRGHDDDDDDDPSPYFAPGTAASVSTTSLNMQFPAQAGESSEEGRGTTLYLPLQEHAVCWEQSVDVVIQMSVGRETHELFANELKLVVQQLVIPGDPNAPTNPRLGSVSLNLAEYADKGPVTRKYLLQQSKTNALLKLTVHVSHVGGFESYIAPPLQKGQVMAGITGLLSHSAPYHPPTVPMFHSTFIAPPRPSMDHDRDRERARTATQKPQSYTGSTPSLAGSGATSSSSTHSDVLGVNPNPPPTSYIPHTPYTPSRGIAFSLSTTSGTSGVTNSTSSSGASPTSPTQSGPSATRDLIEALFNPVPSASTQPSPFTYFDPSAAAQAEATRAARAAAVAELERDGVLAGDNGSGEAGSEEASEESSQRSATASHQQRGRHWWKVPRRKNTAPSPAPAPPPTSIHGHANTNGQAQAQVPILVAPTPRPSLAASRASMGGILRVSSPLPFGDPNRGVAVQVGSGLGR